MGLLTVHLDNKKMHAVRDTSRNLDNCSDAISRVTISKNQTVLAPYGIGTLFSLIYLGARGETRAQMAKFFGLDDNASILKELEELTNLFETDKAIRNHFAFYVKSEYPLETQFQEMLKRFGEIRNISFNEMDRKAINALVEAKTDNMIKDFISNPFDPNLMILLLNTILCKPRFINPFNARKTKNGKFIRLDGSNVTVSMMTKKYKEDFQYTESDLGQIMELFCGGTRCVVGFILPRKNVPIERVQNLDPSRIHMHDNWVVEFHLPRFTIETEWDFTGLLKNAGLTLPFSSGGADFTGVGGYGQLYISMAIQKARIEVDEKGATAAAASAIGGCEESCMIRSKPKAVTMKCDRTFCGYIRLNDKVLFRFTYDGQ
jgi:serpin B